MQEGSVSQNGVGNNLREVVPYELGFKGSGSQLFESLGGGSCRLSVQDRSAQTAPLSAPEPPCASSSCFETLKQFARHVGLSRCIALQLSLCHCSSSRRLYQHRWDCYRRWCSSRGHSVSNPSVSKIAIFCLSSSPSGGGGRLRLLYPGCLLHRPISGQSWTILDLTLGEFPEGLCRFSLT